METSHLPSMSVAISSGGTVVYEKTFGHANVALETRASPATIFAQGSVTKVLTAVAAMMLTEGRLVDLDAPVQQYCPAFPTKQNKVTLRQLLAHTAGVRHYNYRQFEKDFLNRVTYNTVSDALMKFKDDPLVAIPGEEYNYSSWGYVVAACAIEGASKQSFNDFVATHILAPAGMSHSVMDIPGLDHPSRATGYSLQKDGSLKVAAALNPSDRYGASGLLSTPSDMIRFSNALLDGKFIDKDARETMWSPQALAGGETTGHALGWDLDEELHAVAKGGTAFDATSYQYLVPSMDLIVAISTNRVLWSDGRIELARELARVFGADAD
jgi:CubicO group peptidase (beta-lactamase class C family)